MTEAEDPLTRAAVSAPGSRAFHRIARTALGPHLASLGLHPGQRAAEWVSEIASEQWWSFRLQLSDRNRLDSPDGCEFTAELEVFRRKPIAGGRLFSLLTEAEREEHRQIQNLVIAKLSIDEAELARLPPYWQADRLARVAPRFAPYPPLGDVWFRYVDEVDVHRWMDFIRRVLPDASRRLLTSPDVLSA